MGPCVLCRRRATAVSPEGPLCAACRQDAADDARGRPDEELPPVPECVFPDDCRCDECQILDAMGLT